MTTDLQLWFTVVAEFVREKKKDVSCFTPHPALHFSLYETDLVVWVGVNRRGPCIGSLFHSHMWFCVFNREITKVSFLLLFIILWR